MCVYVYVLLCRSYYERSYITVFLLFYWTEAQCIDLGLQSEREGSLIKTNCNWEKKGALEMGSRPGKSRGKAGKRDVWLLF